MFRKSVFIMVFVCLLATVCPAGMPPAQFWDYQLEWSSNAGDANWYNPNNWNGQNLSAPAVGGAVPPDGPDANNRVCVLPNQPGPRIGIGDRVNAKAYTLELNPWDPTSWGPQDCNVSIMSTALDVNMGSYIGINSTTNYDSYIGTNYLASRAIVNVYGGTVTTPGPYINTAMTGIRIGGGASGIALAYGMLNIYGGEVTVPRLALYYGEIDLSGGILHVNADQNFIFSTTHPEAMLNKIKINGGTLIIDGNYLTTDPCLPALIAGGYVICERGTLGTPTYDIGTNKTTLIADVNYCVWRPQPTNNATNVHYKVPGNPSTTDGNVVLSWQASTLEDIDVNHDVYFGVSFADINTATKASAAYKGSRYDANGDPCSFALIGTFAANTSYYWRVDEIDNTNIVKKGLVWTFKTHDGKAYNPRPANGATVLRHPLELTWTAGDWAASHKVYFTTQANGGNLANPIFPRPTDSQYRGQQTSTTYSLASLFGAFALVNGNTYYWCIDEVNGTTWKGPVWSLTPTTYTNIDDFEDSASTDDVNANWLNNYPVTGCDTQFAHSGRTLVRDATGKYLQFTYNNSGLNPAFTLPYTEAKRAYPGGTSFTGGGVVFPAAKLLQLDFRGNTLNPANPPEGYNPLTDNMYVAIEDTAGNVSVLLNPDANAQLIPVWTSWYAKLTDINVIGNTNLNAITGFALGFGIRCNNYDYDGRGDDEPNGIMFFDNIRLYGATCVPIYGPEADLDGDCDVDINDMDRLANDWLLKAETLTYSSTPPVKAPIVWYNFNNTGGDNDTNNLVSDYGTGDANNYTGTIQRFVKQDWDATGGRDGGGCIYLISGGEADWDNSPYVDIPLHSLNYLSDPGPQGTTFSIWIKADLYAAEFYNPGQWNSLITITISPDGGVTHHMNNEKIVTYCPTPTTTGQASGTWERKNITGLPVGGAIGTGDMPIGNFGGKWNHWAFVKGSSSMRTYLNGTQVAYAVDPNPGVLGDSNDFTDGPLVIVPPVWAPGVDAFMLGERGGNGYFNWGNWAGRIDDFQMYDYALSAEEVAYLATDTTGEIFVPLVSTANLNLGGGTAEDPNQIVNFGDMAIMGQQWHTLLLYP